MKNWIRKIERRTRGRDTVATLTSKDTNRDGQLTGTELAGINAWIDANENGHLDANELQTLTQANLTQIKSDAYIFYTQGNAVMGAGVAAEPVRPAEAVAPAAPVAVAPVVPVAPAAPVAPSNPVPLAQTIPASNYRTLRDTDNQFLITGGVIAWTANDIKINYNNQSYLIGTDGNDSFNVNYHNYVGSPFNTSLITNFLAGGGDDDVGGSAGADNLWGGLGNDIVSGYAGDDMLYGEEGNDLAKRRAANDALFELRRAG